MPVVPAWLRALARAWIPPLRAAATADLERLAVQLALVKGLHQDAVAATVTAAVVLDRQQHLALFVDADCNCWMAAAPEFQRVSDRRLVVTADDGRTFAFTGSDEDIDAVERMLYRFRRGVV